MDVGSSSWKTGSIAIEKCAIVAKKQRESSCFQLRNLSLAALAAHLVRHPICIHIRRIRKSSWNDRLVNASIVSQRNAPRRKRTCLLCSLYATHQCLAVTIFRYYDSATTIVFRSKVAVTRRTVEISTETGVHKWTCQIYWYLLECYRSYENYSIIFDPFFFFSKREIKLFVTTRVIVRFGEFV